MAYDTDCSAGGAHDWIICEMSILKQPGGAADFNDLVEVQICINASCGLILLTSDGCDHFCNEMPP